MNDVATISVDELAKRLATGKVELIDVRTPVEFRAVHVVGARNIPLDTLRPSTLMEQHDGREDPLYAICQGGVRGAMACRRMLEAGYEGVVNVEGGTQAWIEAGLPVVRGAKAISLERQVRIVAGSLVLLGVLLGFLAHPYFFVVSAFVGAGLLFAGLSDTCGMALLLAKMPWNQRTKCKPA